MSPFDAFLLNPILNLLVAIYKLLALAGIPGALAFAIILLTAIIRLALWPLTTSQLKSTKKMAELKPHLERIKTEHGHDKLRHQQEVSKLYKEHGVNPLAGCLPLLLQIPIFIALYQVLLKIVEFGKTDFIASINSRLYSQALYLDHIPDPSFLGFNLAAKPSQWQEAGFLILLIPIATGAFQFIQSKMMAPTASLRRELAKTDQKQDIEDSMAQVQSQMILIMPLMIAFFSYGFPVGLSLYWNTFTLIGIVQQYRITGAGALNKYLPEKWRK
ncbi:membrane protein insertase YidC [Candidatus Curtissbacteria bacterium]|nr:membrane protein insertase YidC [Candidatus Curtissbacteria bacterium]